MARDLGIQESVVFTGSADHDQIAEFYSLIDIFVVPRINERAARYVTPLKPFEAMAMRIPLIVSDLPALIEIAAPGSRGLSFPVGDADALADQICLLLDNKELASRLGRAGHDWVASSRRWELNGDRYLEAYSAARSNFVMSKMRKAK
jgi:glycosyltransferase involved in cell wall biosynthesis